MIPLSVAEKEILIVEDDPGIADLMLEALAILGLNVIHVVNGATAIERIRDSRPILMILDYSLPDMTAAVLVDNIQKMFDQVPPFIVTTGAGDEKIAVEMMKRNARDYIVKDSLFFDMLPAVTTKALKEIHTELTLDEMRMEIKDREDLLKAVFEAATGIAFIICDLIDSPYRIIEFSPGAEAVFGYNRAEMMGLPVSNLYGYQGSGSEQNSIFDKLCFKDLGDEHKIEITMMRKSGDLFPCLFTSYTLYDQAGQAHARLNVVIDISERKKEEADRQRLETKIQYMQKLESLGLLAGGIAHDFNNLLMAILGHAGLGIARLPSDSPVMKNLLEIEKASVRAGELCNQMLAYAGKGRMVTHQINLSDAINGMTMMVAAAIPKKIRIVCDCSESCLIIDADSSQIKQIVMNLVVNSAEAIGESPGLICVEVGATKLSRKDLEDMWLGDTIAPGEFIFLKVADNGCGMTGDIKSRIFDPFFSTKFVGRGLGLAALLGIVKAHGGSISVKSIVNEGTTVTVYFPKHIDESEAIMEAGGQSYFRSRVGKGTVLLVDDDETIRTVGTEMLETIGFRVITACDGRDAIDVFGNFKDEIQCVLLDLAMPNMDGVEAFEKIRNIKRDALVILSSGYSESEIEDKFQNSGYAGFIQKPYKISDLADRISKVITKL